jgi:hypothetical protein
MARGRELITSRLATGFSKDELDQFSRNLDIVAERLHEMINADKSLSEATA